MNVPGYQSSATCLFPRGLVTCLTLCPHRVAERGYLSGRERKERASVCQPAFNVYACSKDGSKTFIMAAKISREVSGYVGSEQIPKA